MSISRERIIVDACNVHLGGGYTLLLEFLNALERQEKEAIIFLDARLRGSTNARIGVTYRFVSATIISRLKHYFTVSNVAREGDVMFCFGNLPPFFKPKGLITYLYLQNWFLICDIGSVKANNFLIFIRILVERILIRVFLHNVDEVFVQTASMRKQAMSRFPGMPVTVRPFTCSRAVEVTQRSSDYIYPARADEGKNHVRLIAAWIHLSELGLFPVLTLTIDTETYPELTSWISEMKHIHALKVENIGFVDDSVISSYYSRGINVIFPSFFESFGIPLVEANALRLDILASERDFVRDVCCPAETFDPDSHI